MSPCEIRMFVIIILVITVAVAFMYYIHAKQFMKNSNFNEKSKIIKSLTTQSAQWAISAKNNSSPIVSLVHADYAAANLWSLRTLATNEEIKAITGVEFSDLYKEVTKIQDQVIKKITTLCPNLTQ